MLLSGIEIQKRMRASTWRRIKCALFGKRGAEPRPDILIRPFDEKYCQPNSYDVHLADTLRFYKPGIELPPKDEDATIAVVIPDEGLILQPGEFCLGSTLEHTETHNLVPRLVGCAGVASWGLSIVAAAGFGDIGYKGVWTMHIKNLSKNPVRLTKGMKIGQLFYSSVSGKHRLYAGKYLGTTGATASRLYQDVKNETM